MAKPQKPPEKKNPHIGPSLDQVIAERDATSPGFAAQVDQEQPTSEPALTTQVSIAEEAVSGEDVRRLAESVAPVLEEKRGPTVDEAAAVLGLDVSLVEAARAGGLGLKRFAERQGWSPSFALDALVRQMEAIDEALAGAGRSDIDRSRAMVALLGEARALERFETKLGNDLRRWVEESPDNAAPFCWAPADVERQTKAMQALEAQLQPAHNAFGPLANARGLVISHVKDSAPDYDVGGRYHLALVSVEDGEVRISEVADVINGEITGALPFGHVRDHLEKRVEDFITPKAHRS